MSDSIAIKITEVSKKYTLNYPVKDANGIESSEHWALKDISLEIKKGESVGIIGPNGSGKSTLLKILSGVTKPTSGRVEIFGRVASILDIGAGFHPELSGKENVYLNAQLLGFNRKEIKSKYDQIVDFSGIGKFINEPVKNYSNGMYLRLAFSILAHLDFDIYLFDEVMGVGDAEFLQKSKRKIAHMQEEKKTTLFITHNLSELTLSNKIIELADGLIKNIGAANLILNQYSSSSVSKYQPVFTRKNEHVKYGNDKSNNSIKLLSIGIKQESDEDFLTASLPLQIEICYERLNVEDQIDPLMLISDVNGVVIFSASPVISGYTDKNSDTKHKKFTCTIPSNLLSFNVYVIGLIFLKNGISNLETAKINKARIDKNYFKREESFMDSMYLNLMQFKVRVVLPVIGDLESIDIPYGLVLPRCNWQTD